MNTVLHISSITGIDLELQIAGPGARSYAFTIDWHIRAIAAAAWLLSGLAVLRYAKGAIAFAGIEPGTFSVLLTISSLAIYFLYHPVAEILMHGRTPGKRMAGVRLVTRNGSTPGIGALLIRNIFRLIDSLPVFYCVGLAVAVANRESLRIGDIAAGTLLVYDAAGASGKEPMVPVRTVQALGLERAEVVRDLLDRWNDLQPEARTQLALRLLAALGAAAANPASEQNDAALRHAAAASNSAPEQNDAALRDALEGLVN